MCNIILPPPSHTQRKEVKTVFIKKKMQEYEHCVDDFAACIWLIGE